MDHINLKKHSTTSDAAAVEKSTVLPVAVVGNKMSKSSIHSIKRKKASKTGSNSSKPSTCVTPAVKAQLKPSKLQEPLAKSDLTKNLFTSFSMNQSLKSNPMLQGLSGNCDKTWPVPLFQIDSTKEPVATTFGSIAKGLHSLSSLASTTEAKDDKKNVSCNFCNTSNGSPCSACSTGNSNSSSSNTSSSNFFKTAHSTICIPQQSSVITSSPFRHLMVGPKISNMPTPFNGPINNNNNNNSSPSSCQETPVIDQNVNEENNCKILFHSGRGESHFVGPQTAEQPVGGAEPPIECAEPDMASKNNETLTPAVQTNSGTSKSSERKYTKAHLATMDPERLALIMQRKRDKKFRKLQSLSALMRAPDDRHSMGPLAALKRELTPNTLLGASSTNLSSNPFNRSSLTSRDHLNKLAVNNPWKGENSKKPCSFIHEPSLKNSAILSQNSLELPKRKLDYQKDINSPNSNLTVSDLWKMSTNREPVKENRSASTSSVIDDALRIAALKFIKNEVKDNESTAKDATPISAEIFGSHKIKTPNFFPPRPKEDSYTESGGSSSSGEENTKAQPTNINDKKNTWSKENKSRNFSKPAIKSRKRTLNSKRKPQMNANATSEQNRSMKRLPENNSNSSDNESSAKETEKSSENKRSRISQGVKRKRLSVTNKRRGRPPMPNKLKNLKSVKRRGRPPVIGALKSKLQQRAVKCRNTFNKRKLVSTVSKVSKRRGRPPKNLDAPSKPEVPKLTDEDVMKVKLNIPRRRGRPSKAETMLREMAVAHLAATEKASPDAGKVNIGLGLTIRPRLTRKRSSASQPNLKRQRSLSQENVGSYGTKRIKTEPVSSEESTSDMTTPSCANELDKNIKEETNPDFSHHDSSTNTLSSTFEKGQRKRKSVKGGYKNDPDYINDKFGDDEEDENGDVPANRSRPLLLRNVKKNSKPIPSYTDSSESDVEEPSEVAYKSPKQRVPIAKVKPTIKMCKSVISPLPPSQLMPPIYNVPRVLLPPSIKDTGIPCKMCAKVHTQDHFFKYMELKSTDQPHRCPLCGQYFTWSCLFIEHMRSHPENTAQYRCEYCYAVSRKISAYFNCRITHCPPSKEWLELQKTCDEYLAKVNEAKEKKQSRYTKVVTNRVIKTEGNNSSALTSENIVGLNEAKDKPGKFPKVAPNNNNNRVVAAEGSRTTETKMNLSNEAKDRKNSRCMKSSSNKLVKNEAGNSTGEVKDPKEKLQMGQTNGKNSGRKNSNSKKPFLCEICQKTFLTFDFLTKHKQSHKSKRTFMCVECDKQFSNKAFFNVHNLTYHKHSKKSYTCEVCRVNFTYLNLYTNHVNLFGLLSQEEHIQRSLQALVCHICNRGFKLKQSFVNHVLTHTGERPFVCEVCNQAFTQMGSLDRHRRIHQKDKRSDKARRQDKTFVCKICQKVLSNELAYNNHMQTHEEDNRFFCDFCEQSFPNAHLLKTHKHNEQRPHKCKNCGRCYKLKQTLSEHKRVCGL